MKKTYIIPCSKFVLISQANMMALSTNMVDLGRGGYTEEAGIIEGGVKTYSYSVWDDDWSK